MKPITLRAAVHKLVSPQAVLDREISERVGQEILRQTLEPGAWATALAVSGGKKQDALAAYARLRIQHLSSERKNQYAKSQSFEARRLNTCLGIKTVQDLLNRSNRGGRLNLIRPKLSLTWLMILLIGSTGSIACLARLFANVMPGRSEHWLLMSAPFLGTGVVLAALISRLLLPKSWVMQGWNTGLYLAGTVACFGSLFFGAKVVARTPPAVIDQMVRHSAPATPRPQLVKPKAAPVLVKGNPGSAMALSGKEEE
ncbi:hypothetical protein [Luteolibacter luteus]|uniref:Uncharacterized protein n=1 Tax=Luteolibacter luteus TaxID=2728835 RepID=A0A858RER5_9BACT|nr:hypothetical protein [Luteolibacter luteus]QJE95586.1 hypothetical protein HHL09_07225 [Luteolibacter luteus]